MNTFHLLLDTQVNINSILSPVIKHDFKFYRTIKQGVGHKHFPFTSSYPGLKSNFRLNKYTHKVVSKRPWLFKLLPFHQLL